MSELQRKLDYGDAVASWLLQMADHALQKENLEEYLSYAEIAASICARQNRVLTSEKLETTLRSVAEVLPNSSSDTLAGSARTGTVFLHVLSEALKAGGLTAMAVRWMQKDQNGRTHSIALLSQRTDLPHDLVDAVVSTGGRIYKANESAGLVEKALWLRQLAHDMATIVVLHIDVADVICGTAFGISGGPPVLLVNHNAHMFWIGSSFVDVVVNCRGSELEKTWTVTYRGIPRCATVPIPLEEPEQEPDASSQDIRHKVRQSLDIPRDAVVFLTVGSHFKYIPLGEVDFVAVWVDILERAPRTYLVVAGFKEDDRWRKASLKTHSRIKFVGVVPQSRLAMIHSAVDVYVEGFPFGTTTALLEAGAKGLPVVLSPAQCPPPFGSDGVALDDIVERSSNVDEYKKGVVGLAENPDERKAKGLKVQQAIMRHHVGRGWHAHLESALQKAPGRHSTYGVVPPPRTPDSIHAYWLALVETLGTRYDDTLENAIQSMLQRGLRPLMTDGIREACSKYWQGSWRGRFRATAARLVCNKLLPMMPPNVASHLFRVVVFVLKDRFILRVYAGIKKQLWPYRFKRIPYAEYQ